VFLLCQWDKYCGGNSGLVLAVTEAVEVTVASAIMGLSSTIIGVMVSFCEKLFIEIVSKTMMKA
jgi:hypothetical protein